jgi:hypothetical protein
VSRPEKPLLLRVFGYVEPGTTAAATNGPSERFFFQSGGGTPLFPSRSHRFGTGGSRTLFGSFRLFDIHIPLKTMDIWRRKITLWAGVRTQIAGGVPLNSLSIRSRGVSPRTVTNAAIELDLAGSERLCLPAKIGPYSVHALHQICARDAQTKSDLGVAPAVYHPPLQ